MQVVERKQLLEAGVHFGHHAKRWNPKMKSYIFQERNGIHIIDLQQTVSQLEKAMTMLYNIVQNDGKVLFVGTKKQAHEPIQLAAEKTGMFYVTNRWLGGMLTNFKTIRKSVARLKKLNDMEEDGVYELLPKKEVLQLEKERQSLERNLGGIKEMKELPDVVVLIDPGEDAIATKEANKLGIPIIALVDTNTDPSNIDLPIPGNDDAIRSISLIIELLTSAIVEAKEGEDLSLDSEIIFEDKKEEQKEELKQNFVSVDEIKKEEVKENKKEEVEETKVQDSKEETEE